MALFQYIGIDSKGKRTAGSIDAENERAARLKLRRMGVFPTTIGIDGVMKQKMGMNMHLDLGAMMERVKTKDIAQMTRQLATLLDAHIPLVEALSALVDQIEHKKLRGIISSVKEKVVEGVKLSEALKPYPKVFNELYVNMVNAGESSGALDIVLNRLAEFTEGQARLQSKVLGAMMYPAIMAAVALIVVAGLMIKVVPDITTLLADMNIALPLQTRILKALSDACKDYWYVVAIIGGFFVYGVKRFKKSPKGRAWWDDKALTIPLFGRLNRLVITSQFSRTLSTLLASGVPLLGAMDIVRGIISNTKLRKVIEQTRDSVREGQSIAEPLKRSGQFPPMVIHMIQIGEKTGELEKMLERVANSYDEEVNRAVSNLTTMLEPIMIVVMAGIVGFIISAILPALMKLQNIGE